MNGSIAFAPQVRAWVLHNIANGVPPGPLARQLVQEGADAQAASALVQTLWDACARGSEPPAEAIAPEQAAAARYVPQPSRLASAHVVRAGDREVRVSLRIERPMLAVLENVLGPDECDALIALAQPRLAASTLVDPASGADVASMARTSQGMFFRPLENALVERIDRRVASLMGMPVENGESLQVLRYGPDALSSPHFDFLMPTNIANRESIARSGQRVSTLVMYLNDPPAGGETVFPEAGITVAPHKGSAVYFEYCNSAGQLDPLSLHAAMPVRAGEKWVATRWMRQRAFRAVAGSAAA